MCCPNISPPDEGIFGTSWAVAREPFEKGSGTYFEYIIYSLSQLLQKTPKADIPINPAIDEHHLIRQNTLK